MRYEWGVARGRRRHARRAHRLLLDSVREGKVDSALSRKHVQVRLGSVLLLCVACGGKAPEGGSGFNNVDGSGNSPDSASVSGSSCGCGPVVEDASFDGLVGSDGSVNQSDADVGDAAVVGDGGLGDGTID